MAAWSSYVWHLNFSAWRFTSQLLRTNTSEEATLPYRAFKNISFSMIFNSSLFSKLDSGWVLCRQWIKFSIKTEARQPKSQWRLLENSSSWLTHSSHNKKAIWELYIHFTLGLFFSWLLFVSLSTSSEAFTNCTDWKVLILGSSLYSKLWLPYS